MLLLNLGFVFLSAKRTQLSPWDTTACFDVLCCVDILKYGCVSDVYSSPMGFCTPSLSPSHTPTPIPHTHTYPPFTHTHTHPPPHSPHTQRRLWSICSSSSFSPGYCTRGPPVGWRRSSSGPASRSSSSPSALSSVWTAATLRPWSSHRSGSPVHFLPTTPSLPV